MIWEIYLITKKWKRRKSNIIR